MKSASRITALILAILFIFSLTACGTLTSPLNSDTETDSGFETDTGTDTELDTETDIELDPGFGEDETGYSENAFTVALRYMGEKYNPEEEITIYWKSDNALEKSTLNSWGYAGSEKLDGDYRVTVSGLAEDKVYNPNIYNATNDNKHLIIDVYDLVETSGVSKDPVKYPNNGRKLNKIGIYSVTLKSAEQIIYFDFFPSRNGKYVVESWMDVTEGKYNPICEKYVGTTVYKNFVETIDGGGEEGVYTKNFKNGIDVNDDMIGNVLTFGIHVDAVDASSYPVTVVFAISLNGEHDEITNHSYDMYAPEDPNAYRAGSIFYDESYKIVYAETPILGREDAYEFVNDNYKLFSKDHDVDGDNKGDGDGYYHVYDEEKYSRENYPNGYKEGYPPGYGPILYAQITMPCRFLDNPLNNFEIYGKPLSIKVSDELRLNYKHFIEGYSKLAKRVYDGQLGKYVSSYYCYIGCPCHPEDQIENYACLEGCTKCLSDCRNVKREFVLSWDKNGKPLSFFEGIQAYSTLNGGVAVTEELKTFLARISVAQRYFADGEGWMETHETIHVDAADDAMWLFPCFYFEKIN